MDYQQILELVKEVSKAGLTNFEYTEGNIRIAMSCPQPEEKIVVPASNIALQEAIGVSANSVNGANTAGTEGVAATAAAQSQAAEAVGEKGGNLVKSPLVGTFYAAPSEDAEPFIKVGDTVKKGQTLAIVEAMKLMNEIESEFDGVVTEILVENEENVEYGTAVIQNSVILIRYEFKSDFLKLNKSEALTESKNRFFINISKAVNRLEENYEIRN